ncbi:hypothetical protein LCGC14_0870970 [marine sediment metagenome]|uniref:Uncharacterized protein n=1 Tax=marine sediment metagenome TaxID=412755 RepID=A0A0F9P9L3_9ZZZZ
MRLASLNCKRDTLNSYHIRAIIYSGLNHLKISIPLWSFHIVGAVLKGDKMQVLQMRPTEQVCVDHVRLGSLYAQLGEVDAEDVVARTMEELALRISHCDRLFHASNWGELRKNSRSLIAIADQVGLAKLTAVARDVTKSIDQKDHVAVAATLRRLIRIGERSLTAILDMPASSF